MMPIRPACCRTSPTWRARLIARLRPPRELIVHPAFAQVARRFQFVQMSRHEARSLGVGASDIGILAQRLRQLQGETGEFAITAFGSRGLLWADGAWREIDPIGAGEVDESVAGSVFCMAWAVARRFRRADAAHRASLRPRRGGRDSSLTGSADYCGVPGMVTTSPRSDCSTRLQRSRAGCGPIFLRPSGQRAPRIDRRTRVSTRPRL